VRRADGSGRVAAMEVLINSPQIRELILEGKTQAIEKAMAASGDYYRMQTFNQSLAKLTLDKAITEAEATAASTSPNDLKLLLKGVTGGGISAGGKATQSETRPAMKINKSF
jgi:twitching motility protein PilT